jgi:hypothetical protein
VTKSPEPEVLLASGLVKDERTGKYQFVLKKREVDSSLSFATEALVNVLNAKKVIPWRTTSLKFVAFLAGKHAATLAINIAVSQIFDMTVITILDTIGDASFAAAATELRLALREPRKDGKTRHRLLADSHLGISYQAAKKSAESAKLLDFGRVREKAHRDATIAAMLKASISRDAGLAAADHWLSVAASHFAEFDKRTGNPSRAHLAGLVDERNSLARGSSFLVNYGMPPQWVTRKQALRDVEKSILKAEPKVREVNARRDSFTQLCQLRHLLKSVQPPA